MGWLAIGAGVTFGLALVLLVAFFVTRDERFDRVAEWAFVAFAAMAVVTMITVAGRLADGIVVWVVTVLGIAGVVILGLGEMASALRIVDFRRIAPLVTLGFLAFLAWIGATSVLVVADGGLPVNLGWLGILTIVLSVLAVASIIAVPGVISGQVEPPRRRMLAFFVPLAGIVAWMAWLGLSL